MSTDEQEPMPPQPTPAEFRNKLREVCQPCPFRVGDIVRHKHAKFETAEDYVGKLGIVATIDTRPVTPGCSDFTVLWPMPYKLPDGSQDWSLTHSESWRFELVEAGVVT